MFYYTGVLSPYLSLCGSAGGHVKQAESEAGQCKFPGGVLGLEKGTDCGPSAAELWLSRANNAKKGGLSNHYRLL